MPKALINRKKTGDEQCINDQGIFAWTSSLIIV